MFSGGKNKEVRFEIEIKIPLLTGLLFITNLKLLFHQDHLS